MLIGLNGRLKSGKDTTFELLRELEDSAERVSFADILKDSAADSIGMTRELLEFLKNDEEAVFVIAAPGGMVVPQHLEEEFDTWAITGREYLQWYGTEGHRAYFGDDFWVDAALPIGFNHDDRFVVVTDMRFPNEVQRIIDLGGITVKVERDTTTSFGDHPSEQNLDKYMDYTIDNTKDLDHLEEEVTRFYRHLPNLDGKARGRKIHTHATQVLEKSR